MEILFKLFLLAYVLAMVLITILSVVWILTAIFTPEWVTKKKFYNGYKRSGHT
jgi:hypothetical protein